MADNREQVSASLTATGRTDALQVRHEGGVTVMITGSFTATVDIEAALPGGSDYAPINTPEGSALQFTSPAMQVIKLPGAWDVSVNCSAFTDGQVDIQINSYRDKARGV